MLKRSISLLHIINHNLNPQFTTTILIVRQKVAFRPTLLITSQNIYF